MSSSRCYLDYNASAPLRDRARQACIAALQTGGNASSIHAEGRAARRLVEGARRAVAALVRAAPDRIVFTSGGTESANLVLTPGLRGVAAPNGTRRLLVSATEHPAVLRGHEFADGSVTSLSVGRDGRIDLDGLKLALAADGGRPALVAVQAANNETGVLQPVAETAAMVHAAGGLLVCDAVQAIGRVPFEIERSGADAVLLSGHKIGGPQGTGAVVLAAGVTIATPLLSGGGQERGLRGGTENVQGIAGFGAAADEVHAEVESERLLVLRERLEASLCALERGTIVFGVDAPRLPNTTCFAIAGLNAETLLMALDLEGIAVSSGSACSSGKVGRSHVLEAMGVEPDQARAALRVSSGFGTSETHIDRFVQAFETVMRRTQRRSLAAAA